jgi:hypothetical protein
VCSLFALGLQLEEFRRRKAAALAGRKESSPASTPLYTARSDAGSVMDESEHHTSLTLIAAVRQLDSAPVGADGSSPKPLQLLQSPTVGTTSQSLCTERHYWAKLACFPAISL